MECIYRRKPIHGCNLQHNENKTKHIVSIYYIKRYSVLPTLQSPLSLANGRWSLNGSTIPWDIPTRRQYNKYLSPWQPTSSQYDWLASTRSSTYRITSYKCATTSTPTTTYHLISSFFYPFQWQNCISIYLFYLQFQPVRSIWICHGHSFAFRYLSSSEFWNWSDSRSQLAKNCSVLPIN